MFFPLTQSQRSILAVICVILFLWTGKKFVWNKGEEAFSQDSEISTAEVPPESTTTTPPASVPALSTAAADSAVPPDVTTVSTETTPQLSYISTDTVSGTPALSTVSTDTTAVTADTTAVTADTTAVTTVTETDPNVIFSSAPATPGVVDLTAAPEGYFNDALFIGDSRTVGMASYGPIEGATYYATVGLSTYKLNESKSETPDTQGKTFDQVLSAKQYGKVYIMLGINETGYTLSTTMQNFRDLIVRIRNAHPNAIIYLQANLHVSASRSQTDAVVNNTVINNFNAALAEMADDQTIFYLDVNPLFDDETGALSTEYTRDGTHPVAKSYITWSDWIRQHVIVQ